MSNKTAPISAMYIVPGLPHILLAAHQSPKWQALHTAYAAVRAEIAASDADVIVYFSSQWYSVLGYMFQGQVNPRGKLVDGNWHALGTMSYDLRVDRAFAEEATQMMAAAGHTSKLIDYEGFPIDSGTIVAANLLDPNKQRSSAMVSCNIYADYAETCELGRACAEVLARQGKKAIAVLVSSLSHRFSVTPVNPPLDTISSSSDDQWNQRILALLERGALQEVVALAPQFAAEAHADMGFKGAAWLQGLLGGSQTALRSKIFAYQPVWGTGAALVGLYPDTSGDQRPIVASSAAPTPPSAAAGSSSASPTLTTAKAPPAVGPYPHARRHGDLLFISGMGPRRAGQSEIPGVTLADDGKTILSYDVVAQTHSVFANLAAILAEAGSSFAQVVDVQVFLTDIGRDFADFNKVYGEYFSASTGPTRTTVEVGRLPTPIAVELKVIASVTYS